MKNCQVEQCVFRASSFSVDSAALGRQVEAMSDRWLRSLDGTSMIRVEEVTGLRVDGDLLLALSAGHALAVAQGSDDELARAEVDLARLIESGDEDVVIAAVRGAGGIEWDVASDAVTTGSDSGSVSIKALDKDAWERNNQ
jgi:hypothetical protein